MPVMTIYLPDELAHLVSEARKDGLRVSPICQQALRKRLEELAVMPKYLDTAVVTKAGDEYAGCGRCGLRKTLSRPILLVSTNRAEIPLCVECLLTLLEVEHD